MEKHNRNLIFGICLILLTIGLYFLQQKEINTGDLIEITDRVSRIVDKRKIHKLRRRAEIEIHFSNYPEVINVTTFQKKVNQLGINIGDEITFSIQKNSESHFKEAYSMRGKDKVYFTLDDFNNTRMKGSIAVRWLLFLLGFIFISTGIYQKNRG